MLHLVAAEVEKLTPEEQAHFRSYRDLALQARRELEHLRRTCAKSTRTRERTDRIVTCAGAMFWKRSHREIHEA